MAGELFGSQGQNVEKVGIILPLSYQALLGRLCTKIDIPVE